jgi:hypothetical protein
MKMVVAVDYGLLAYDAVYLKTCIRNFWENLPLLTEDGGSSLPRNIASRLPKYTVQYFIGLQSEVLFP